MIWRCEQRLFSFRFLRSGPGTLTNRTQNLPGDTPLDIRGYYLQIAVLMVNYSIAIVGTPTITLFLRKITPPNTSISLVLLDQPKIQPNNENIKTLRLDVLSKCLLANYGDSSWAQMNSGCLSRCLSRFSSRGFLLDVVLLDVLLELGCSPRLAQPYECAKMSDTEMFSEHDAPPDECVSLQIYKM